MSGPIAYARADLTRTLASVVDIPVIHHMPERLNPPCVIISEGTPLLTTSTDAFGHVIVNLEAAIIGAPTTNELTINRLDALVDEIVTSMSADYIIQVGAYQGITTADGQHYLTARINFQADLTL